MTMHRPATQRRPGLIVAVLAMTGVVATGIQTLIVPLLGQLPSLLDASAADTAWVVTVPVSAGLSAGLYLAMTAIAR